MPILAQDIGLVVKTAQARKADSHMFYVRECVFGGVDHIVVVVWEKKEGEIRAAACSSIARALTLAVLAPP